MLRDLASLKRLELKHIYVYPISQLDLSQLQHLVLDSCSFSLADISSVGQQCQSALQILHICSATGSDRSFRPIPDEQQLRPSDSLLLRGLVPLFLHKVCRNWPEKSPNLHAAPAKAARTQGVP